MSLEYLHRYDAVVDDIAAFHDAVRRPLPSCIWTHTLRTTPERVQAMLLEEGITTRPLSWYPGAFEVASGVDLGNRFPYAIGLYQIQETVSLLPVLLLDPRPGERILDLCAAPGNKTAQIAMTIADHGTVVANDKNSGRMHVLRHTMHRLGFTSVCYRVGSGTRIQAESGSFDRVLVDVPCTCEGTCRKHPSILRRHQAADSVAMARLQRALLARAVDLCRPGGRLVYSTCTFAPEENEAVVDAILKTRSVRVLPAAVPGFVSSPGLTAWEGTAYDPSLANALRVWPHQNDTGGFFVALLEKP